MKKHTGLMLPDVQGPLKNLLSNLSGDKADYWLRSLKKFLRQENPFILDHPYPKEEVSHPFFTSIDNRIDAWIELFERNLSKVCSVERNEIKELPIIISVRTSNSTNNTRDQFVVRLSGIVSFMDGDEFEDPTYKTWKREYRPDGLMIEDFFDALRWLEVLYNADQNK
jgi:hypothetical protein